MFLNQLCLDLDVALTNYNAFNLLFSTISCCILRRSWVWSLRTYLRHQTCLWMEEFMRKYLARLWSFLWIVAQH